MHNSLETKSKKFIAHQFNSTRIRDFNNIITTELQSFSLGGNVYTAELGPDFYTFFEQNQNTHFDPDGVHPNALGYAAMAQEWHDALLAP